jgi:hypothetical protein
MNYPLHATALSSQHSQSYQTPLKQILRWPQGWQLEANLIEQYQPFSERPLPIENIEFLDRGASKKPIIIVPHRNQTEFLS